MENIKIRYTWKRGSDENIIQRVVDLTSLEDKGLILDFSGYRLVAKDLWTGEKDKDGNDVFDGDTLLIPRSKSFYNGTVIWDRYNWAITPNYSKLIDSRSLVLAKLSTITGNVHLYQVNPQP